VRRAALAAVALTGIILVLLPTTAASASQAQVTNSGALQILGSGSDNDGVTVSLVGSAYTVTDTVGITPADATCSTVDPTTVTCPGASVKQVFAELGAGDDTFATTAPVPVFALGGDGSDTITGGPAADDLVGGGGDDTLHGGGGDDTIAGELVPGDSTNGTNTIAGDAGNDTLGGAAGNDTIDGGTGNDTATGFGGDDTISGGDGADVLSGGDGTDVLRGGAGDDTLGVTGTQGPASGSREAGNDTLDGGDGNDVLDPGLGAQSGVADDDTLSGGPGFDRVSYAARVDAVNLSLDGAANDGASGEHDNLQPDIEAVTGGQGDDTITGAAGAQSLDGGPGSDTIDGGAGDDTIDGGAGDAGDDVLSGGDGNDTVNGDAGDDVIAGGDGADALAGGGGVDQVDGGAGNDVVTGGAGADTVDGGAGNDVVNGSVPGLVGIDEGDTVNGGAGDDRLAGGDGDDELTGGPGADVISGGDGSDTALYEQADTPVTVTLDDKPNDGQAGEGDNVQSDVEDVVGGGVQDTFTGNASPNLLDGGAGEDYVDGGGGVDTLAGGGGADVVRSRDGNSDHVNCGRGLDFAILDKRDRPGPSCERFDNGTSSTPVVSQLVAIRPAQAGEAFGLPGMHRTVPLVDRLRLPFGSTLDATAGAVVVKSARSRHGGLQTATLSRGAFVITQPRAGHGLTDLTLTGGASLSSCPVAKAGRRATAAAKRVLKRLAGQGHGRFATRTRNSTATVRGTTWLVEDRCDGTLTRSISGTVVVHDLVKNRTVTLKSGHSYLARRGNR
jgi:Ca2+-binding RTX toxin-like protein